MNDPKWLGIPNICFSLTKPDDKREPEFIKQRLKDGFDDSETWSLCCTISNFILPRLKRFKILSEETTIRDKFHKDIIFIIDAFELVVRNDGVFLLNDEETIIFKKGMKLFHKNFMRLWW